ncbi:MAG: hypothetical protein Q8O40_16215 [Chloroflexota bacterium]|nr:hypothetical protein [Chloroflexota bacterium]
MEEGPAFAQYIKGWEYLIAIVFNLAFVLFWVALNHRHSRESAHSAVEPRAPERLEAERRLEKAA